MTREGEKRKCEDNQWDEEKQKQKSGEPNEIDNTGYGLPLLYIALAQQPIVGKWGGARTTTGE